MIGRKSARPCVRVRDKSSPASISTPISAAWRCAPRRSRSGGRVRRSRRRSKSRRSSPCVIRGLPRRIRASSLVSPCGACRELIFDYDPEGARDRARRQNADDGADRRAFAQQIPAGIGDGEQKPRTQARHRRAPRGRRGRGDAAPAAAFRVCRPGASAQEPRNIHRSGAGAPRGARSRALRRPAPVWARRPWRRSWRANSA